MAAGVCMRAVRAILPNNLLRRDAAHRAQAAEAALVPHVVERREEEGGFAPIQTRNSEGEAKEEVKRDREVSSLSLNARNTTLEENLPLPRGSDMASCSSSDSDEADFVPPRSVTLREIPLFEISSTSSSDSDADDLVPARSVTFCELPAAVNAAQYASHRGDEISSSSPSDRDDAVFVPPRSVTLRGLPASSNDAQRSSRRDDDSSSSSSSDSDGEILVPARSVTFLDLPAAINVAGSTQSDADSSSGSSNDSDDVDVAPSRSQTLREPPSRTMTLTLLELPEPEEFLESDFSDSEDDDGGDVQVCARTETRHDFPHPLEYLGQEEYSALMRLFASDH
eukprot:TRINITY_DN2849_c0_g1_i1.p1 TRINITY_DN2849_c0_g1~~TRINITY_DN2849_c0_g1_i1.p1  ORF type:complete len:339 (+),score=53.13 TRINITY_DN2849_c0_g1_i1:86-1102(+)